MLFCFELNSLCTRLFLFVFLVVVDGAEEDGVVIRAEGSPLAVARIGSPPILKPPPRMRPCRMALTSSETCSGFAYLRPRSLSDVELVGRRAGSTNVTSVSKLFLGCVVVCARFDASTTNGLRFDELPAQRTAEPSIAITPLLASRRMDSMEATSGDRLSGLANREGLWLDSLTMASARFITLEGILCAGKRRSYVAQAFPSASFSTLLSTFYAISY